MNAKTIFLAIILLSMVIYATNYQPNQEGTVEILFSKVNKNPDLVQEMYLQLNDPFLYDEATSFKYTNNIYYLNTHYIITRTYEEWVLFFLMDLLHIKVDRSSN